MKQKFNRKYIIKIVLLIFGIVMLATGCNHRRKANTDNQKIIEKETAMRISETEEYAKIDESLIELRQELGNTSELFAVAYLGYVQDSYNETIKEWLEDTCPQLIVEFPFIEKISDTHIVGGETGELYCIVPRDENATVAINRIIDSWEYSWETGEVLYRSETGDPVLVYCNSGDSIPDIQITITESNGLTMDFYPWISETGKIVLPVGEDMATQVKDFTCYDELSLIKYRAWMGYNFMTPKTEDLEGVSWTYGNVGKDGCYIEYFLELFENGDLRFSSFYDEGWEAQEEYWGLWSIVNDSEETYLKIEMEKVDGVQHTEGEEQVVVSDQYPILLGSNKEFLLLGKGVNTKNMPFLVDNVEIVTFMKSYG